MRDEVRCLVPGVLVREALVVDEVVNEVIDDEVLVGDGMLHAVLLMGCG